MVTGTFTARTETVVCSNNVNVIHYVFLLQCIYYVDYLVGKDKTAFLFILTLLMIEQRPSLVSCINTKVWLVVLLPRLNLAACSFLSYNLTPLLILFVTTILITLVFQIAKLPNPFNSSTICSFLHCMFRRFFFSPRYIDDCVDFGSNTTPYWLKFTW